MKNEHIYTLHLQTVDNCCAYSKQLREEICKHIGLWEKSTVLQHPLFTKKEIIKMMQQEIDDFNKSINREFTKLMDKVEKIDIID
ncbi:MAG: hypothetical protein WCG32_04660 [Actinomycetes bacterium]